MEIAEISPKVKPARHHDWASFSEYRSNRLDKIKKVGAQRPTKIPKRSACA
jgi:hypothetical protein